MTATLRATFCTQCGQELTATALFCPVCGTPKSQGPDADALIGQVLGQRFLVVERMGHGASGTIYRGEHTTLRRKVAIKVLHRELCRDELAVERFRREAITVSDIDNDHIVEIHDFGRTPDERLYLVMELLEGETLRHAIERDKRLPVDKAIDILMQIGEALTEAHAMGYVHRDLRPTNIYLAVRRGRANFVKLLDFGLAKLVESEGNAATTSLGLNFGDPKYISPEQARGDSVDRRSDIYSLGCIAYEMLVGHTPFSRGKAFDILARHVDTMPAEPRSVRSEIPAWLDATVMRMLAKQPDDRFITVYRLVEALRQGQETGQPMAADVARRRETIQPPIARRSDAQPEPATPPAPAGKHQKQPLAHTMVGAQAVTGADLVPNDTPTQSGPDERDATERDATGPADARHLRTTAQGTPPLSTGHPAPEPVQPESSQPESSQPESSQPEPPTHPDVEPADSSSISRAWFADGDLSDDEQLDHKLEEKLADARDNVARDAVDSFDELYFDNSGRKRLYIAAGIIGGLVLLIIILALAWPGSSRRESASENTGEGADKHSAADVLANLDTPQDAALLAVVPPQAQDAGPPDAGPVATVEPDHSPDGKQTDRTSNSHGSHSSGSGHPRGTHPRNGGTGSSHTVSDSDRAKAGFFANLGQAQLRSGSLSGAAEQFVKALALDPANPDAVLGQGEIALKQGKTSKAIKLLKRAVKLKKSAHAHALLGDAYLDIDKPRLAADSFKKALRIDPNNTRARDGYNDAAAKIPPPPEDDI